MDPDESIPPPERRITSVDAAARLRCHPRTLKRLSEAGRLTVYRASSRKNLYDSAEVDSLITRQDPAAS